MCVFISFLLLCNSIAYIIVNSNQHTFILRLNWFLCKVTMRSQPELGSQLRAQVVKVTWLLAFGFQRLPACGPQFPAECCAEAALDSSPHGPLHGQAHVAAGESVSARTPFGLRWHNQKWHCHSCHIHLVRRKSLVLPPHTWRCNYPGLWSLGGRDHVYTC